MRDYATAGAPRPAQAIHPLVLRRCACRGTAGPTGECEKCRKSRLQRQATYQAESDAVPHVVHEVLRSPGQPLVSATRAYMEPRFGHDFGRVRVHTDTKAAESARAVSARAYTVGRNVVFGTGQYKPGTTEGRWLIAHELTHVVQQSTTQSEIQSEAAISTPSDPCEQEADRTARAVTAASAESITAPDSSTSVTIRQKARGLHRAISTGCIAPSEIVTTPTASLFGDAAEVVIIRDYCSKMGCRPLATEHFDNRVFGATSYIGFLVAHNSSLSATDIATLAVLSQIELNRPDILTHKPTLQEFYEIKPRSVDGLAAGRAKAGWLSVFFPYWSLPYLPGTAYTPTPEIIIASGHVGPWPLEVFLRVERIAPGLVVYSLCARGELAKIGLAALLAILAAIIAILSRGRIRIPIPLPNPAPVPIAALASAGDEALDPTAARNDTEVGQSPGAETG